MTTLSFKRRKSWALHRHWKSMPGHLLQRTFRIAQRKKATRELMDVLFLESEWERFSKRLYLCFLVYILTPYKEIERQTGSSSKAVAKLAKILNGKESNLLREIFSEMYPNRRAYLIDE